MTEMRRTGAHSRRTKKKGSHFLLGLLIYVAVFLIAALAALWVLRDYLSAFERSRPAVYLDAYQNALEEKGLPDACLNALTFPDRNIQSQEEVVQWAKGLFAEATYPRLLNLSQADRAVYGVRARGQQFGTLTFTATGEKHFGFSEWQLTGEEYDFSAFSSTCSATVPPDYHFVVNGTELGQEYITDAAVPYEMLEECYEHFEGVPYLVHYESGPYLGELEIRVLDANGRELTQEQMQESYYLNNANDRIRQMAEEFIPAFMKRYVIFSADLYGMGWALYSDLYPYVLPDSLLSIRLRQAFEGFGYVTPRALEVLSVETNLLSDLQNGHYLADVVYSSRITGQGDPVVTQEHVRVVFCEQNGKLQAEALFVE